MNGQTTNFTSSIYFIRESIQDCKNTELAVLKLYSLIANSSNIIFASFISFKDNFDIFHA